jgi:hypothetical protein
MKARTILITGADEARKVELAEMLHAGYSCQGIKSALIKLDQNHPLEGQKTCGYKAPCSTEVLILVGCLNTLRDTARYKRIARAEPGDWNEGEDCCHIHLTKLEPK